MKECFPKMINFQEEDNLENLIKTLIMDPIGRDTQLIYFIRTLSILDLQRRILAINARWGNGKTFFLRQFELLCNYYKEGEKDDEIKNV